MPAPQEGFVPVTALQGNAAPQRDFNAVIAERLAAERARLRRQAKKGTGEQFHRPVERPFLAEDRDHVTLLFGGLTWKTQRTALSRRRRQTAEDKGDDR